MNSIHAASLLVQVATMARGLRANASSFEGATLALVVVVVITVAFQVAIATKPWGDLNNEGTILFQLIAGVHSSSLVSKPYQR
jgi:Mn2+/Fe2+ NRAMP family transporter